MNAATLIFSALGLAGLGIVGIAVKALYLNVEKVVGNAAVRVLSSIFAVFVLIIGVTLAGLSLSYVLTKEWHALPHFMLLACLCGLSIYFQLKPTRKQVAAAAQAAPARVEPTADPVTETSPIAAPASAEQSMAVVPVVAASAVAATTVAAAAVASEVAEASLPDVPPPAVISAIADTDLDAWTPDEEEVAAPSTLSEASSAVAAPSAPEPDPQAVLAAPAPADADEVTSAAALASPAAVASSFDDEAADVLDLNGVTKVSVVPDTVNAEQHVDAVKPASDNEATRAVVAAPSEVSVAVA